MSSADARRITVMRIADELMNVLGTGRQVGRYPDLDREAAYAVVEEIRARRERRGERVVGRKIGFTNTRIWPLYGVRGPMWNYVYDSTVGDLDMRLNLAGMPEPKIEPEIAFGLGHVPDTGMDDMQVLGCVAWAAHSFEVVQSVYPAWKLTEAESAAAFGLHGALRLGPRHPVGPDWADPLRTFTVTLRKNGVAVDRGVGANVLGGPVQALRFLVQEVARTPGALPLAAGEIITTGTLTDAQSVTAGDTWTTDIAGLPLDGIRIVAG